MSDSLPEIHDRVAEAYQGSLGPNFMRSTQARVHWICARAEGPRVLDIGCSQGIAPVLLAREAKQVTGIDVDPQAIAYALGLRDKEPPHVSERLEFVQGDALTHDFGEQLYDTVILGEVLEHLNQPGQLIEVAAKFMKEDGQLIVTVPFGVNDYFDHKATYYLSRMYVLLNKRFEVVEVEPVENWIAFVGRRRTNGQPGPLPFDLSLIEKVEQAFAQVEARYSERLRQLQLKFDKLQKDKKTLDERLKAISAEHDALLSGGASERAALEAQCELLKSEHAKELEQVRAEHDEVARSAASLRAAQLEALANFERVEAEKNIEIEKLSNALAEHTAALVATRAETEAAVRAVEDKARKQNGMLDRERRDALAKLQVRVRRLEAENKKLANANSALRDSTSFRIGNSLAKAARKIGLRSFFRKGTRSKGTQTTRILRAESRELPDRPASRTALMLPAGQRPPIGSRPRIAGVMDTFTYSAFSAEADVEQLRPDTWQAQLAQFQPDFVMIESAWEGIDGAWKTKISHNAPELRELLADCARTGVPTVFWNKEDPVHFTSFLPVASQCDVVFTTDIDSVPAYKDALGHDRVYLLPFAAQPTVHNPIELFDRKDAFNFAGSYYVRYPERQRDMSMLLDTASTLRDIEIFDRNAERDHPHYSFPERYRPFILGALPFSEIEKAYKGYKFGININTIKRSQSMFARRVFELMASNTPVVSNFSRGVRLFFGDLVVSSDNGQTIAERLRPLTENEIHYRKFRLAGLRKVMSEHTYALRLAYIMSKLPLTQSAASAKPQVHVVSVAASRAEIDHVLAAYQRQNAAQLTDLRILYLGHDVVQIENCRIFQTPEALAGDLLSVARESDFIAFFSPNDYYGPNYLTDMMLATAYSDADVIGKAAYYLQSGEELQLQGEGQSYRYVDQLPARAAILKVKGRNAEDIANLVASLETADVRGSRCLSIDEFNYCRAADSRTELAVVDDIEIASTGARLEDVLRTGEAMSAAPLRSASNGKSLDGKDLAALFGEGTRGGVTIKAMDDGIALTSKVKRDDKRHLWAYEKLGRADVGLLDTSEVSVEGAFGDTLQMVFEFYDAEGDRLSHTTIKTAGKHTLMIPEACESLRIGLRCSGLGAASLKSVAFGRVARAPQTLIARSRVLVLTKQYPTYSDLYKYGFLHSRIRAYQAAGAFADVCKIRAVEENGFDEFENVDVAAVDESALSSTLGSGQYTHLFIHVLDRRTWRLIQPYLNKVKVVIWAHGAEVQLWQRRHYEFEGMTHDAIEREKKLSNQRLALWKEVVSRAGQNLHFVFVSRFLLKQFEEDFGLRLPQTNVSIIHNYIDAAKFTFEEKAKEKRGSMLSIRPYAGRTYANDLTVAAIVELSKRPVFRHLKFTLIGSGPLFSETTAPVAGFENVELRNQFLRHEEIAEVHRNHGVFLSPTRMDSQGVSRDEAMASGLVPITTRVAAIPEFVDEGCGIVVEPEDAIAIADAVEWLYKNPDEFQRLSEAAAARVRAQSGYDQTIRRELELFAL
jgi:glycosyltransferase involved in cell wall biosynthesis/SAM-dependent methyltransferase